MSDSTRPDHTTLGPTSNLEDLTTPDQRAAARRIIERHAHNLEDRAELLLALGLTHPGWHWQHHPTRGGTASRRRITTKPAEVAQ